MPISRRCRITLENFCEGRGLPQVTPDTFKIEGIIHPKKDLHSAERVGEVIHWELQGFPRWGVTYPTVPSLQHRDSLPLSPSHQPLEGYFHKHGEERVYLRPIDVEKLGGEQGQTLIPCYECAVALEMDWGKYEKKP